MRLRLLAYFTAMVAFISRWSRRFAQLVLPLWMQSHLRPGLDGLVLATCPGGRPDAETQRYAAIIFVHGLGDLLLGARCIAGLADSMRERGLGVRLLVAAQNAEFARCHLPVDEVVAVDWLLFESHLTYRSRLVRSLARGNEYALAVHPMLNRRLAVEDSLIRATRARWGAIGCSQFIFPFERALGDSFYTRLIPHHPESIHDLERYREFMSFLGLTIKVTPWRIKPRLSGSETRAWLAEHGLAPKRAYLALCPHASDIVRTWPLANFLEVAWALASARGWGVVVLGTHGNEVEWPPPEYRGNVPLVDLRGATDIETFIGVLAGSELVVANDSGPYHMGISLGRPTLGVAGSGMPNRYHPYGDSKGLSTTMVYRPVTCAGCEWNCIHVPPVTHTAWCIQQVSWQDVVVAGERLLAGPRLRGAAGVSQ